MTLVPAEPGWYALLTYMDDDELTVTRRHVVAWEIGDDGTPHVLVPEDHRTYSLTYFNVACRMGLYHENHRPEPADNEQAIRKFAEDARTLLRRELAEERESIELQATNPDGTRNVAVEHRLMSERAAQRRA